MYGVDLPVFPPRGFSHFSSAYSLPASTHALSVTVPSCGNWKGGLSQDHRSATWEHPHTLPATMTPPALPPVTMRLSTPPSPPPRKPRSKEPAPFHYSDRQWLSEYRADSLPSDENMITPGYYSALERHVYDALYPRGRKYHRDLKKSDALDDRSGSSDCKKRKSVVKKDRIEGKTLATILQPRAQESLLGNRAKTRYLLAWLRCWTQPEPSTDLVSQSSCLRSILTIPSFPQQMRMLERWRSYVLLCL